MNAADLARHIAQVQAALDKCREHVEAGRLNPRVLALGKRYTMRDAQTWLIIAKARHAAMIGVGVK